VEIKAHTARYSET